MKTLLICLLLILAQPILSAQDAHSLALINNISSFVQDSLFVIATIGNSAAGASPQKQAYVTTEVFPNLLKGELTGVPSPQWLEGISLSPNPASDKIGLRRNDYSEPLWVELFSTTGHSIRKYEWPGNDLILYISVADFLPGIYLVKVATKDMRMGIQYKVIRQ